LPTTTTACGCTDLELEAHSYEHIPVRFILGSAEWSDGVVSLGRERRMFW